MWLASRGGAQIGGIRMKQHTGLTPETLSCDISLKVQPVNSVVTRSHAKQDARKRMTAFFSPIDPPLVLNEWEATVERDVRLNLLEAVQRAAKYKVHNKGKYRVL